jgi:hypothetical protein
VQQVDDVAPRGFRDRDDRVGAARERVLPRVTQPRVRQTEIVLRPPQWREVVDRDHRAARAKRRQAELRRVIDARARDRELRREQDRIEREHRELGPAKTQRVEIAMLRKRRHVGRREIAET